ncbi:MAG: protein translocase subunit SecDF [Chitinophagales bacterium]|nr:protein translocase subunit SecDF [Chitinophagales bacterium]MDW8418079.1 protein translocase subunit SecDF [Chitinophagales bacterium]
MQNLKGVIKTFAIILVVIGVIQISFTLLARVVEKRADRYASSLVNRKAPAGLSGAALIQYNDSVDQLYKTYRRNFLDSVAGKPVIDLPLIRSLDYRFCRDNSLKLGLDLKGGMSMVLEINEDELLRTLAQNNRSELFNKAIENAKKAQAKDVGSDFLTLFKREFEALDPNAKLAAIFATVEAYSGKINFNSTNDEVIAVVRQDMEAAVSNTFQVLKKRIDQFGVASPNISLQKSTGRIILELPGVEDPSRVRKLLQQTAQLEFWNTYDNRELWDYLMKAYDAAKVLKAEQKSDTAKAGSTASVDTLDLLAGLVDTTAAKKDTTKASDEVSPLLQVLQPLYYRENGLPAEGPAIGVAYGKDTAEVNRIMSMPAIRNIFPSNLRLMWSMNPADGPQPAYYLYAISTNPSSPEAPLTGSVVKDAYSEFDPVKGSFAVNLTMNNVGAAKWEAMTEEAVKAKLPNGTPFKRSIAIVLDGRVLSAPVVQEKISGGRSSISGQRSQEEAIDLANVLKSGKLEARTVVIEEQIVGPSLGEESIRAGLISLIAGFVLVFLFMVAYYSTSGLIANAAMLLNVFILVSALISFGAAFTLPAMAGILLTLAMAVDANVIINERIREEVKRGKGLRLAVDEGYQHSYSAIIDGNLTTMVVSIVLMVFGLGPIYGFGFTLFAGILTSLFTAVLVSRLIFDWAFDKGFHIAFGNKFTMNLFKGTNFDFYGKRKITYLISGILVVISIASMIIFGFDLGVDFKGGRSYVIQFDKPVTTAQIASMLEKDLEGAPQVKTYGSNNQISITTDYLIDATGVNADSIIEQKIYERVKGLYDITPSFDDFRAKNVKSSIKIEAAIADDIRNSSWKAILFGLLGVFIYIFIRFRKIEFAAGSIIALAHDPIIVLGIFSLFKGIMPFSLEIDQNIIAAVLTLIGYSVNDTVVVFDRIREYMKLYPAHSIERNVNDSINSTLSRTIMTVFTVMIVSVIMFLFAGATLRGFSFALIIGLIIGTYSSIFIASPIMVDIAKRRAGN